MNVGVTFVNTCISKHLKEQLARIRDKRLQVIGYIMLLTTVIPLR